MRLAWSGRAFSVARAVPPVDEAVFSVLHSVSDEGDPMTQLQELYASVTELDIKGEGSIEIATGLVERMESASSKLEPEKRPYGAMLRVFMLTEQYHKALDLVSTMRGSGIALDAASHRIEIAAHCAMGDIAGAGAAMKAMEAESIRPNNSTLNWMLRGYARAGDVESAEESLAMMLEVGVSVEPQARLDMFDLFASKGIVAKAIKQIKAIRTQDADGPYGSMLARNPSEYVKRLLENIWVPREVRLALRRCRQSKFDVGEEVYAFLVRRYIAAGRMEDAADFVNEMSEKEMRVPAALQCAMVEGYIAAEMFPVAQQMYEVLQSVRVKMPPSVYRKMLDWYLECSDYTNAFRVIREAAETAGGIDAALPQRVVDCFVQRGETRLAVLAVRHFETSGLCSEEMLQCVVMCIARDLSGKLDRIGPAHIGAMATETALGLVSEVQSVASRVGVDIAGPTLCVAVASGDEKRVEEAVGSVQNAEVSDPYSMAAMLQYHLSRLSATTSDTDRAAHFQSAVEEYGRLDSTFGPSARLCALLSRVCCDNLYSPLVTAEADDEKSKENVEVVASINSVLDYGVWYYGQALRAIEAREAADAHWLDDANLMIRKDDATVQEGVKGVDGLRIDISPACKAGLVPAAVHHALRNVVGQYMRNRDTLESPIYGDGLRFVCDAESREDTVTVQLTLAATRPPVQYLVDEQGILVPRASLRKWVDGFVSQDLSSELVEV